jgi:DNA polymerase-4
VSERRVVAHCDIDAFYASVELLRRPELKGKPLVVAGTGPRSVVTTASYEARKFGIDSAMPASRARALCPHAVFIAPDHAAYREKSQAVWTLVRERIPMFQQVGIDEAYLDVTEFEKPMRVLHELVAEIEEQTGMVMSVGVGPSKLVAKTVSSNFKPRAFKAVSREDACRIFADQPTRILQGIGPKTAERLATLGASTVRDLQQFDDAVLAANFGENTGPFLKGRAWFHDDSPVAPRGPAKSRSNETTFPEDVADRDELEEALTRLTNELCSELQSKQVAGRNIAIKVRLDDWTTVTRARTINQRTNDAATVLPVVLDLFREYAPDRPVRLLGVRLAAFEEHVPARPPGESRQLVLPLPEFKADAAQVGVS